MQENSSTTLNVQHMGINDKYIIGKYKVEILTLPRIYKSVEITQSSLVNIDIDAPGNLSYKLGNLITGQIFVKLENGTFDWVCNIDPNAKSGQWLLQPGNYVLISRQKSLKSAANTMEKEFRIISNKTTTLNL